MVIAAIGSKKKKSLPLVQFKTLVGIRNLQPDLIQHLFRDGRMLLKRKGFEE